MAPVVDLTELQNAVGKYADQHRLIVAAGPLTAASILRAFVARNKLASGAVIAGGAWFAIQEFGGPSLKLIEEQFGYLQSFLGG